MKKTAFYFLLTAIALMFVACEKGDDSDPIDPKPPVGYPPAEVDEYFYFEPTTFSKDTANWDSYDNGIGTSIGNVNSSNLVLNVTFDNVIRNEVNNGITTNVVGNSSKLGIKVTDPSNDLGKNQYITLCAWIYIKENATNQTIFSKVDNDGNGYVLNYVNNIITFSIKGTVPNTDPDKCPNNIRAKSNVSDVRNKWLFVTAIYGKDSIKLYVYNSNKLVLNEAKYDEEWRYSTVEGKYTEFRTAKVKDADDDQYKSIVIPESVKAADLYIGNSVIGNSPFNGSIDQVMVFNKALTSDEVSSLYDAQK